MLWEFATAVVNLLGGVNSPDLSVLDKRDENLDMFVTAHLQPTEAVNRANGEVMDDLAEYLRKNCPAPYTVREIIKGGSLGKGTAVRHHADFDLVLFLNEKRKLRSTSELRDMLEETDLLDSLENCLRRWPKARRYQQEFKPRYPGYKFLLTMTLKDTTGDSEDIEVDLLPAFDNLGQDPAMTRMEVYSEMAWQGKGIREYYSSSLVKLQVDFLKTRPASLKNLIRLVKWWRKKAIETKRAPTSYPLELICIHAWERVGKPEGFNIKRAFKDVLLQIENYQELRIVWEDNYGYPVPIRGPVIMDPANPFANVAERFNWNDISKAAGKAASSALLDSWD